MSDSISSEELVHVICVVIVVLRRLVGVRGLRKSRWSRIGFSGSMELVVAKEVVEEAVIAPAEDAAGAVVYLVKVRAIDLLAKVLAFAEVGK